MTLATNVNSLPIDLVATITSFSGQLTDAEVCKTWHKARGLSFQYALNSFRQEPSYSHLLATDPDQISIRDLFTVVTAIDKSELNPDDNKSLSLIQKLLNLKPILQQIEQYNLCEFFSRIIQNLPDQERPRLTDVEEIKDYLQAHPDLTQRSAYVEKLPGNFVFIPAVIGLFSNLKKLEIHHNPILYLPEEIGQLTHLEKLIITHSCLQLIPKSIGNLTSLQELTCTQGKLSCIPEELTQLGNLRMLDLSKNKLSQLPDITKLSELQRLILSSNQLTTLPTSLKPLRDNLRVLDISHNPFAAPNQEILKVAPLQNLRMLYLYGLSFEMLPEEIGQIENLIVYSDKTESNDVKSWWAFHSNTLSALSLGICAIVATTINIV